MTAGSAKRILIAPLDWGLGHTTRCIPIIRRLISRKCEVVFAGNDNQQTFIKRLFPDQHFRYLSGYDVRYGKGKVLPALLPQLPGIVRKISQEHDWLLRLCREERIDGIISDNRYGLWHPEIPSVILTHQAQILSGLGRIADKSLLRIHRRMLTRFRTTWVVDVDGPENLAGVLSQSAAHWPDTKFIGWLSQFEDGSAIASDQHLLILLSGPEPQRSLLSNLLWDLVGALECKVAFVEGRADVRRSGIPGNVRHFSQSSGAELQELIARSSMVVCRSGYSTLMDLMLFRKPALLIPTPGQTEQEYLARHLSEAGFFRAANQNELTLTMLKEGHTKFSFPVPETRSHCQFESFLDEWLDQQVVIKTL